MGQLTNQYVSQSYQGLLKLEDSTTGVTSTLQYVQDGVGNNLPIQVSTSSVNITGSFFGDGSGLTGITVDSGSLVTTSSFNAFTSSIDGRVDALEIETGSLQNQINQKLDSGSFNSYTSSNDSKVNSLINATGSYVTETESGSFVTNVQQGIIDSIVEVTKGDGTTSQFTIDNVASSSYAAFATSASYAPTVLPSGVVSGSQQIVDLGFLETGSFNSYTSSNDAKVNSLINATGSYATTSSLTSLSQSIAVTDLAQDGRLNSIESTTSSLQNQINQKLDTGSFNSYTSSNDAKVDSLISATSSYATTGSNDFVGQQNINGSVNVTGSLHVTNEITALSASITFLETIYQTSSVIFTSGSNILGDEPSDVQTLNGRVDIPLGNLNVTGATTSSLGFFGNLQGTASYATNALSSSHSVNADTASYVLNAVSSSYSDFALSSSFAQNAISSSHAINADNSISSSQAQNAVSASHSINSDNSISSSFAQNAISSSHSVNSDSSISSSFALNANSASYAFNATSASWADNSNSASYAQNATSASYSLNSTSASFAQISISSSFSDFAVSSSQAQNAATASYISGSILNQNLNITGSLTASGLNYPTADNGEFSFMQTDGNGNLSLQYVKTMYETVVAGENIVKGSPLYVSGSQGANSIVYNADAADPAKMPAIYIAGDNINTGNAGRGIVLGLIEGVNTTGYSGGTEVFVAAGGGWTDVRPTGSTIIQSLGIVTKEGAGGQGVVLNPGPANLPNIQEGYVWVGNSDSHPVAVPTSSFIEDLSLYTTTASFNSYTSSTNGRLDSIEAQTGSYATTSSLTSLSTSIAATDLAQDGRLNSLESFTGSIDTNFVSEAEFGAYTGSNDGKVNALIAATGSYATTGSNIFLGKQTINVDDPFNQGLVIASGSGAQAQSIYFQTAEFGGNSQPTIFLNGINSYWQSTGNMYFENAPGGSGSGSMNFTTNGDQVFRTNGTSKVINFVNPAGLINISGSQFDVNVPNVNLTGSLKVSGSADFDIDVTGRIKISGPTSGNTPRLFVSSSTNNTIVAPFFTQVRQPGNNTIQLNNSYGGYVGINKESDSTEVGLAVDGATFTINWTKGPILYVNNDPADSYDAVFGFQDKTNYTDGRITLLKNTDITGSLNVTGSVNVVGPVSLNTIQPNDFKQNLVLLNSTNAVTSSTVLQNYLNAITTSLDNDDVNFAFIPQAVVGPTGIANQTGSVFISGSNNFIMNLGSALPASQGRRNILGNLNFAQSAIPSINTSSLTIPNISNNYLGAGLTLTFTTGSNLGNSAHAILGNLLLGGMTVNHPSASTVGQSTAIQSNINVGTITSNASGSLLTNPTSFNSNINTNPSLLLRHISGSIQTTNNLFGGNIITINNGYLNTGSNNVLVVSANTLLGQSLTITAAGSPSTNVTRPLVGNLIGGQTVNVSLEQTGTDLAGLRNSIVYGYNLNVTGSHSTATTTQQGTAMFGRWNGEDNGLSDSARTVFSVGTGTGTSNRRTGFYITSGSLVGVSGSLDVKGDSTITGSLTVSGSVQITGSVQGNVNNLTVASNTASLNLNNGNFFVLALTGSQDIRIEPSNIKPGQTVNIKLNTTGSGTVSFPSSVKQISGSAYVPTTTTGTDIITLVSFDSSDLFLANVKNLI